MEFSRFNIIKAIGDYILAYNTLNGNVIRIRRTSYRLDNPKLEKLGFVVKPGEDLLTYSYIFHSAIYHLDEINLVIATSMNCNLCCPYCFERDNRSSNNMTDDIIENIVKYINSKKDLPINITWFGGEPMLNYKAINRISQELISNNIKFKANLITNGTILPNSFLNNIDKYNITTIQVTLDGIDALHNEKRYFKTGVGSFDRIISNIAKLIKSSKSQIVIKFNIDKRNIDQFNEVKQYLTQHFPEQIHKGRVLLTSNYIRNKTNFDGSQHCLSCSEYFDFTIEHGRSYQIPNIKGPCPLRIRGYLVIGPDGLIYKCMEHLGQREFAIGNIQDFKLSITKTSKFALSYDPTTDPVCSICSILPICGGGCPNERTRYSEQDRPCPAEKFRIEQILNNLYNEVNS